MSAVFGEGILVGIVIVDDAGVGVGVGVEVAIGTVAGVGVRDVEGEVSGVCSTTGWFSEEELVLVRTIVFARCKRRVKKMPAPSTTMILILKT